MTQWYYTLDNRERLGPVTNEQLRQLALDGSISPDCMVVAEGGEKWIPAAKVKGLFPKPAPLESPPVAILLFQCRKCGRAIPLQQHELSLTIQCARCRTQFVPSQVAAQAPEASTSVDDPALLRLVKDVEPARQTNGPLDRPGAGVRRGSRILVAAIVGGVLLFCAVVSVCIIAYRGSAKHSGAHQPRTDSPSGTSGWTTNFDELDAWCMRVNREIGEERQRNWLRGESLMSARAKEFKNGLVGKEVHWRFPVYEIRADGVRLETFRYHPGGSHFPSQILTSQPGKLFLMVDFGMPLPGVREPQVQETMFRSFFPLSKDRVMSFSVGDFVTVKATVVGADWELFMRGVFCVRLKDAVIE
jgi:hypothetical protein